MELIWHIMLTVCLNGQCMKQDVQWFEEESECRSTLTVYQDIPPDGNWDTVTYECKPVGSTAL